jgi:hypothetical protein
MMPPAVIIHPMPAGVARRGSAQLGCCQVPGHNSSLAPRRSRKKVAFRLAPCAAAALGLVLAVVLAVCAAEYHASCFGGGMMIHYSCDCCKRELDPEDLRYVVKMEVYAAFDPSAMDEAADDRDHLQEIQEILQRSDEAVNDEIASDVYEQLRFDLCPECHRRFLKNPLDRELPKHFDFSKN